MKKTIENINMRLLRISRVRRETRNDVLPLFYIKICSCKLKGVVHENGK